jgi:hypothetical protein
MIKWQKSFYLILFTYPGWFPQKWLVGSSTIPLVRCVYLQIGLIYVGTYTGANPMIVSYNASTLKIYNATRSLVPFENKNILFYFEKTL